MNNYSVYVTILEPENSQPSQIPTDEYDVVANIKPIADDNNDDDEEEEGDYVSAALWKTGTQEPVSSLNYLFKYMYAL